MSKTVAEKLVGKELDGFRISEDREQIIFTIRHPKPYAGPQGQYHCHSEPVVLQVYGDCCSYSWIESVDNPNALFGKVLSVEDIEMPEAKTWEHRKEKECECVSFYGLKIVTERGHCVIDYRNDSNGYYGGWIS